MRDFLKKNKTRLLAGTGLVFTLYFAGTVTDADANRYSSKEKRIVAICFTALLLSLSWKSVIRNVFDVTPPDMAEVFSIPEQQIAACIADGLPFSEEEKALIAKAADFESSVMHTLSILRCHS